MHPYDHARSSARLNGGVWQDYNAFHAWFDATKAIRCRFTHRALRHHREGIEEAKVLFGEVLRNSAGALVETGRLGLQHLEEDCRMVPSAADWLDGFERPGWFPDTLPDPADLARESAARFGGSAETYRPLHLWFLATETWTDGTDHLAFRHHSFGIFEAEARFGPVLVESSGPCVPTRIVAERHVQEVVGRIALATDLLRRIRGERWMLQATSPRKLGLDVGHHQMLSALNVRPMAG